MADMSPTRTGRNVVALHARKQDLVRNAIWDAAIDLFAEAGFEETTIEDIARAAGVSTRTFFRYFASKNDLMGQGMVRYRALLSEAIHDAPKTASPLEVVRHTVRQVASVAAAQPRVRDIVKIATRSVAAREAQLSRRAEVEDAVSEAFAARGRTAASDEITPRLMTGLTLAVLDITFRVWSKRSGAEILDVTEDVFDSLVGVVSGQPDRARKAPRAANR
jgi:TetR/AcrR family transcriptional regulator, regulator of mycofactocin system